MKIKITSIGRLCTIILVLLIQIMVIDNRAYAYGALAANGPSGGAWAMVTTNPIFDHTKTIAEATAAIRRIMCPQCQIQLYFHNECLAWASYIGNYGGEPGYVYFWATNKSESTAMNSALSACTEASSYCSVTGKVTAICDGSHQK